MSTQIHLVNIENKTNIILELLDRHSFSIKYYLNLYNFIRFNCNIMNIVETVNKFYEQNIIHKTIPVSKCKIRSILT